MGGHGCKQLLTCKAALTNRLWKQIYLPCVAACMRSTRQILGEELHAWDPISRQLYMNTISRSNHKFTSIGSLDRKLRRKGDLELLIFTVADVNDRQLLPTPLCAPCRKRGSGAFQSLFHNVICNGRRAFRVSITMKVILISLSVSGLPIKPDLPLPARHFR